MRMACGSELSGCTVFAGFIVGVLLIAVDCPANPCPSLRPIRELQGVTLVRDVETATGLSADGSVVVGRVVNFFGNRQAYRLGPIDSGDATMQLFGHLGELEREDHVGVSPDGGTVVGISDGNVFSWTADSGIFILPEYSGTSGVGGRITFDASIEGAVITGGSRFANSNGSALWTMGGGTEVLGQTLGLRNKSNAVSHDGTILVGTTSISERLGAFRWTADEGMVALGFLRENPFFSLSEAHGISADGTTIVGGSEIDDDANGFEAFVWTEGNGMVGLGDLPGGRHFSTAFGVSADGSIVVGLSESDLYLPTEAMIWDAEHGMRALKDVLQDDHGLDLTGTSLSKAVAVSDDGLTIIGEGCFGGGCAAPLNLEPWIATLPDPASFDPSVCPGLFEPDDDTGTDAGGDGSSGAGMDGPTGGQGDAGDESRGDSGVGRNAPLCGVGLIAPAVISIGLLPIGRRRRHTRGG